MEENIKLINGDALEEMQKMIEKGINVDCIITDPPYEFKPNSFGGGQKDISKRSLKSDVNNDNFHQKLDFENLMNNYYMPLMKKINFVSFCTEPMLFKMMKYAEENKLYYTVTVWNKTNPTPLCNNRYLNSTEWIIHIREKGVPIYGEYKTKHKVYTSSVNKADKKEFGHPTIKPLELMKKYIVNHTKKGDIVLDPYMGSGSTGVACANTGRKFIGIELDKNYFEVSKTRILDFKKQGTLF